MSTHRLLRLEALEARDVPATFGLPWPDAERITVSFVPDGTRIGQASSDLFSRMDAAMPREQWQAQMLRAIREWASAAGAVVDVVADDGSAMGTAGKGQGDPRFGDIRIGGTILSAGAVAESVPPSPGAGTWAGDLLFNTAARWGRAGYDVFTTALHEAGHAFGVKGQTSDPAGAMYEHYTGVKTGLTEGDLAALRAVGQGCGRHERPDLDARGTLSASSPQQFRGILMPQAGVVRLQIDLGGRGAVQAALFDLEGKRVWSGRVEGKLDARLFLKEGAYTLRLVGGSADGSRCWRTPWRVRTTVMSDPIGPTLPPISPVPVRNVAPTWYNAGFKIVVAALDPYGRPVRITTPVPVVYLPPSQMPKPWK